MSPNPNPDQPPRRSALTPLLGPEFDAFLTADVGNDRNDMPVTVVSALSRLDLDAWQEAARLARLPTEAAIRRLTGFIELLAGQFAADADPSTLSARLVALLPRRSGAGAEALTSRTRGTQIRENRALIIALCFFVAVSALYLFGAWLGPSLDVRSRDDKGMPQSTDKVPRASPAGHE